MTSNPRALLPYFKTTQRHVTVSFSSWTELCPFDPRRVYLFFGATTSSNQLRLSTDSSVSASTHGILLPANQPYELTFRNGGILCQSPWFGTTSGANPITVLEVFYDPPFALPE